MYYIIESTLLFLFSLHILHYSKENYKNKESKHKPV